MTAVRADVMRGELLASIRRAPFQPFAIVFENGDRAIVEHPENVAFDSVDNGRERVWVLAGKMGYRTTLSAITCLAEIDDGEAHG